MNYAREGTYTNIRFDLSNRKHVTDVIVDGQIVRTTDTHKSQIRSERESLLWKPNGTEQWQNTNSGV